MSKILDFFSYQLYHQRHTHKLVIHIGSVLLSLSIVIILLLNSGIGKPIWFDEFLHFCLGGYESAMTAWQVLKPTLLELNHGQTGVYMMIDYMLLKLFGASALVLRLPSLLSALWLLFSAIILMKNRGFGWLWQLLIVFALYTQPNFMMYAGEARPYMPLAAATVGVLTYYLTPEHLRTGPLIVFMGWGSALLGCVMHPYFSLYWFAVFVVAHSELLIVGSIKPGVRNLLQHVNLPLLVIGSLIYFGIGALTWLQRGPDFKFDPFRWIPEDSFLHFFLQVHLGFALDDVLRTAIFLVFLIIPVLIFFNKKHFRSKTQHLVGPVLLFFVAIIIALIISYLSYHRDYWIIPRQWIASLALVPIATLWLIAEVARLVASRNMGMSAMATTIIVLILSFSTYKTSIKNMESIQEGLEIVAINQVANNPNYTSNFQNISYKDYRDLIELANANSRQGGPVWPVFRRFYDTLPLELESMIQVFLH